MSEEIILPEGYTRVAYLQDTGIQYIDTKYIPTKNTGLYVKAFQTSSTDGFPMSSGLDATGISAPRVWTTGNCGVFYQAWIHFGTLTSYIGSPYEGWTNWLNEKKSVLLGNNGKTTHSFEISEITFTPTRSIYLFRSNTGYTGGGWGERVWKGSIYRAKISEGTEIVRDFIPCLDNNGVPCMYDLVGGETYYNRGTGTFGYVSKPYDNNEDYESELPTGYTKCLYLQSDGTQYINTSIYKDISGNDATSTEAGILPTDETGLYIKAQRLNHGDYVHFGCFNGTQGIYPPKVGTSSKNMGYRWNGNYIAVFSYDNGDDLIYSSSINLYNDRTIHFNSEGTDWDGYITETLVTFEQPLWLFSWNDSGSFTSPWGGRIYRAKITQGTELIRDFVPCLDSSGVPCMYDLVNGGSYYNQGSGSNFEYCIDHKLPSDFVKLKYLEATGTQYINTNYIPRAIDNGDGTYTVTTGSYLDTYNVTASEDAYPMGCLSSKAFFYSHMMILNRVTAYGWGAWTRASSSTGKVSYQSKLNFLNNKKAVLEAPIFSTISSTLGNLSAQSILPIYMFGLNRNNTLSYPWHGRIYRAKISEGTEIVRDYVPAFDQRLSRPCMYDIINNVAYYNDGTGEFLCNRDIEGNYVGFTQMGGIGNRLGGIFDYNT